MLIDFNALKLITIPNLNNGEGSVSAKIHVEKNGKIMVSTIPPGAYIGDHMHTTSDDINFVISGRGAAICGGTEENLLPGVCHICPKGESHSIINDGSEDLVLFTVVTEK